MFDPQHRDAGLAQALEDVLQELQRDVLGLGDRLGRCVPDTLKAAEGCKVLAALSIAVGRARGHAHVGIGREWVEEIRATLPEMPVARRRRLQTEWGYADAEMRDVVNAGLRLDYFDMDLWTVDDPANPALNRAEWTVEEAQRHFTIVSTLTGEALAVDGASGLFDFVPASGCTDYPEAQLNATGPTFKGKGVDQPALGQFVAGVGQGKPPRGAVEQPGAQPRLQPGDGLRYRRLG